MCRFRQSYWRTQWIIPRDLSFALTSRQNVLPCYVHIYAYVTIRRPLGDTCFKSCHFVKKVSGQHFSSENIEEAAQFYSQHLPVHFHGVMWKIKSKSYCPVSFSLISAEMNLEGNYRTLRGLWTVMDFWDARACGRHAHFRQRFGQVLNAITSGYLMHIC